MLHFLIKVLLLLSTICLLSCNSLPAGEKGGRVNVENRDSLSLHFFRKEALKSYLEEDFDSTELHRFSVEELDSLWGVVYDERLLLEEGGQIAHAPDTSFTIFSFEGEGCGAYCNPFWISFLQVKTDEEEWSKKVNFRRVKTIEKLPDGSYLVIQESYGRPASVFTVSSLMANHIEIEDTSLIFHPIIYGHPKWGTNEADAIITFSFDQEGFIDEEMKLDYHAEDSTLVYRYGTDYRYCCGKDSAFLFQGHFKFLDGKFIHQSEQKSYIDVNL